MLGYAVFASSRQVIAGPDAAITLLVASAVAPLAGGDPAQGIERWRRQSRERFCEAEFNACKIRKED